MRAKQHTHQKPCSVCREPRDEAIGASLASVEACARAVSQHSLQGPLHQECMLYGSGGLPCGGMQAEFHLLTAISDRQHTQSDRQARDGRGLPVL